MLWVLLHFGDFCSATEIGYVGKELFKLMKWSSERQRSWKSSQEILAIDNQDL